MHIMTTLNNEHNTQDQVLSEWLGKLIDIEYTDCVEARNVELLGFDNDAIIINSFGGPVIVYKHAIAAISAHCEHPKPQEMMPR